MTDHENDLRFSSMACDEWEHRRTCEERGHPTDHAYCAFPPFGLRTYVCACGKVTGENATLSEVFGSMIGVEEYNEEQGL